MVCSQLLLCQNAAAQAKELGKVSWLRNYDEALQLADEVDRPILILFQEVPGCATCRNYGKNVLSHPLIVDAIENEFVPLAIFNNVGGHDREVLQKYNEPTWNNPVIRIVSTDGKDKMERMSGDYSAAGLSLQMSLALRAIGKGVPGYLDILTDDLSTKKREIAYYQMACFWSGEAYLGSKEGVVATEPGWMNGAEVVKVTYDGKLIKKGQLDRYATKARCKAVTETKGYRIDKDPQYYLKKSNYRFLALSEIQKAKINAALAAKQDATEFLSPTQKAALTKTHSGASLYTLPLDKAWAKMID